MSDLDGGDLLAYRALAGARPRGDDGPAPVHSGVRCGRPLAYPVPAADLPGPLRHRPGTYAGVLFAFDLDELPRGQRYVAARFRVALADRRARAVRLAADGDELGLVQTPQEVGAASGTAARTVSAAAARPGWLRRLISRADAPRAWTSGAQSPDFAWSYDDPRGELLLPRGYGMHALLELPAGSATVDGRLGVRVEIGAGRGDRTVASLGQAVAFAEPVSTGYPAPDDAAVRLCLAADVSGYSRHGNAATERIQRELVTVLDRARRAAGIAPGAVEPQKQGDGEFTVLPVGIDESAVIPGLLAELGVALHEVNRDRPAGDPMRLRVALHRGLVKEGANGWIGTASIAVHRILDSAPLREALKSAPSAAYVLGVPDVLYQDVLRHSESPPRPDSFSPVVVDLPEKGFIEHAWLHIGPALN
jgi:hypothetical protein